MKRYLTAITVREILTTAVLPSGVIFEDATPNLSESITGRAIIRTLASTAALVAGLLAGAVFVNRLEASGHLVSQKGRAFQPNSLMITRGDTVTIVNDDSDLLHHVYIESDTFNFDSGDQVPRSRTPVTFEKNGTFLVLCGIHPKMKLVVRVN